MSREFGETCVEYGLEIVRSIELSDVSGACVLLAPEIQQLIQAMRSPEIDGVVADGLSMLRENFEDFALLQVFVDSKTLLYLPEGPIDLNSKTGRFMGTIRAALAGDGAHGDSRAYLVGEGRERLPWGSWCKAKLSSPSLSGTLRSAAFITNLKEKQVRWRHSVKSAGQHNYKVLARILGVTPRGAHSILRNPIYTGWRIIDKKRDISAAGRYLGENGR